MSEYHHVNDNFQIVDETIQRQLNMFRSWFINLSLCILTCLLYMLTYINKTYSVDIYKFDVYGDVILILFILYTHFKEYNKMIKNGYLRE